MCRDSMLRPWASTMAVGDDITPSMRWPKWAPGTPRERCIVRYLPNALVLPSYPAIVFERKFESFGAIVNNPPLFLRTHELEQGCGEVKYDGLTRL